MTMLTTGFDNKVGNELCSTYLNIKPNSFSKKALEQKIEALRKDLYDTLILLRDMDSSQLPNIDEQWWLKGVKHEHPEVSMLTFEKGSTTLGTNSLFSLQTQNAPIEFVFKGTDCFYVTSGLFSYRIDFMPGYVWITNRTDRDSWCLGNDGDGYKEEEVIFSPGSHPHASSGSQSLFSSICTGANNPFYKKLMGKAMKSDVEIKAMLKMAVRWLKTYNVNDAYNSPPLTISGDTTPFKERIEGIIETIPDPPHTHTDFITELTNTTNELYTHLTTLDFDYATYRAAPTSVPKVFEQQTILYRNYRKLSEKAMTDWADDTSDLIRDDLCEQNHNILRNLRKLNHIAEMSEGAFTLTNNDFVYLNLLDMYQICMATVLSVLTYEASFTYLKGGCISPMLLRDVIGNNTAHMFNSIKAEQYLTSKLLAPKPLEYTLRKHFNKHIDALPNLKALLQRENYGSHRADSLAALLVG